MKFFFVNQLSCNRSLIEVGANLVTKDEKGQSALHKACTLGEPMLVKMIIKEMEEKFGKTGLVDILQHEDDESSTPLLVAVESGSHESTKVLISQRANFKIIIITIVNPFCPPRS